jgi:FKBP-type peptidyl-prolyl cis-trans isomerase
MIKLLTFAGVLLLAACNGDSGSVMREIERAEKQDATAAQEGIAAAETFLQTVRAQPGIEARPSGLLIEVRRRGSNQRLPRPSASATVLVHYEGKLADGSVFDSSFTRGEPAEFPLNAVVPGFSEAIQQMRPGDEVVATFPMELGYGAQGRPPVIPPAAPLQFRIILLAFQDPGGPMVTAPR